MPERRGDRRRALVVEDDDATRELLVRLLSVEGFDVVGAASAAVGLEELKRRPPSVVLLDHVLPGDDGLTLLQELRRHTDVPVLFVSGRDDESTRVLALRTGADDYVVKPFSAAELVARIEAVLRRGDRRSRGGVLTCGPVSINTRTREVSVSGLAVELTAREYDLLVFLCSSPRQVFSREQLLRQVWGSSGEWQDPATVTEHVRRLRNKIDGTAGGAASLIKTVRGGGYRFEPGSD